MAPRKEAKQLGKAFFAIQLFIQIRANDNAKGQKVFKGLDTDCTC